MRKIEFIENKQTPGWPFANSEYFDYGDYRLHYRTDPAKARKKVKCS